MNEVDEIFDELESAPASAEEALVVAVDGFEGPLDLLLALARNQKVDLAKISVMALADQYLAFIESARSRNLELAADYLVMAAHSLVNVAPDGGPDPGGRGGIGLAPA